MGGGKEGPDRGPSSPQPTWRRRRSSLLLWMLLPGWGIWARTRYRRLWGSGSVSEWAPRRTWKTLPSLEERQRVGRGGSAHPVGHTELGVSLHPATETGCQRAPPRGARSSRGSCSPCPTLTAGGRTALMLQCRGRGYGAGFGLRPAAAPRHRAAHALTSPRHSRLLGAVRGAQHPLLSNEEAPADMLPVQLQ